MRFTWGICMPRSRAASLGQLRLAAGVRAIDVGDDVWLAGETCDDSLALQLASLPAARQFVVLPDGQLLSPGQRVPQGQLPQGDWQSLAKWMTVALPTAALAAEVPPPVTLNLVRGGKAAIPNVLIVSGAQWLDYASVAPQVRLNQWSFAVNVCGGETVVIVRGAPLPPIPGAALVEEQGIASPAGFTWDPAVDATVLRELFLLAAGDLVILRPDGTHDHIAADHFVRATRSAIRLSLTPTMSNKET